MSTTYSSSACKGENYMNLFGIKSKAKKAIRTKIISVFLDNYILLNNGVLCDEWGRDWKTKSLDEVLVYYKDSEKGLNVKLAMLPIVLGSLVKDLNNVTIHDAYTVLHDVYFGGKPKDNEYRELEKEFDYEVNARGLFVHMKR
jgi:hypothetical protein